MLLFEHPHHTKQIKTITLLFLEEWPPKRIAVGDRLLLFFCWLTTLNPPPWSELPGDPGGKPSRFANAIR